MPSGPTRWAPRRQPASRTPKARWRRAKSPTWSCSPRTSCPVERHWSRRASSAPLSTAPSPRAVFETNSIVVATISTALAVFFSALAEFGFAKYDFPLRSLLFKVLIGTLIIPFQLVLIPLFIIMSKIGWMDSYAALIVPFMAPAFGIFLMLQFMVGSVPTELLDAARIDGSSEGGLFFRIAVPLARPAIGALSIFSFLGSWNSFLWPLIILRSSSKFTLPIG